MTSKNPRNNARELPGDYRNKNFEEVEYSLTDEQAVAEAERCLQCKNPLCVKGCPVNVQIPQFLKKIKEGKLDEAGEIIRQTNFLPSVCGRVCPQEKQCEGKCVVGIKGDPVNIGALERYIGDLTSAKVEKTQPSGKKIAIIGSGCAGMSAAADLAREGHEVVVFEALHALGGVLRYGIPSFRLPREVLDREIDFLKKLGVKFQTNVVIGKSLTIQDLFDEGFHAVFISSGAGLPKLLNIPGENLNNVYSANEFLTRVNLMNARGIDSPTPIYVGKKALIIGGGNVAMDAVRVAKRIGIEQVTIVYRRTESELPARKMEIHHAKDEGVEFLLLHSPLEILGKEGKASGMRLQVMELGEPDESGRRRPVPIKGKTVDVEADVVIVALGTNVNPIIPRSASELRLDRKGYIEIDPKTGQTSIPGVWAGGDIAPTGESTAINAMGAGKRSAAAINEWLKIELTGNELGEYSDIKELRKLAREEYRKLQKLKAYHHKLGEIIFTRKGFDKLISTGADEKKYRLLPKLKQIIETADFINSVPGERSNIVASYWLKNNVKLEGTTLTVGLTILEDENGYKFYNINQDLNEWDKKYPPGTLVESSTRPEGYINTITNFE